MTLVFNVAICVICVEMKGLFSALRPRFTSTPYYNVGFKIVVKNCVI